MNFEQAQKVKVGDRIRIVRTLANDDMYGISECYMNSVGTVRENVCVNMNGIARFAADFEYLGSGWKEKVLFYVPIEMVELEDAVIVGPLNQFAADCHADNQHWWHHPATGERLDRNKGELLCLMHSEISECMEGERKDLPDDKLPLRRMAEVELADLLIRVFDYAGAFGYDLDGAVAEKRAFNKTRADHKAEARLAPGGKKW